MILLFIYKITKTKTIINIMITVSKETNKQTNNSIMNTKKIMKDKRIAFSII